MGYLIRNLHKSFGELVVLKDFNMDIKDNKVISILGPSGCGKTTLLNILSGMIEPEEGEISGMKGKTISYLFQEPRLLSWKTVEGNIDFILKDKMVYEERQGKIKKYLEMVGLWEYKDYYPDNLSGGMKQRAAIARAFAYPSDILLMDEPFKSLDFELKMNLIHDFIGLLKLDNRTVFFVTHDIQAALMLGDEIHLLSQKPTKITETIINSIPHDERSLHNKHILGLAEKLYNYYSESYNKK